MLWILGQIGEGLGRKRLGGGCGEAVGALDHACLPFRKELRLKCRRNLERVRGRRHRGWERFRRGHGVWLARNHSSGRPFSIFWPFQSTRIGRTLVRHVEYDSTRMRTRRGKGNRDGKDRADR